MNYNAKFGEYPLQYISCTFQTGICGSWKEHMTNKELYDKTEKVEEGRRCNGRKWSEEKVLKLD